MLIGAPKQKTSTGLRNAPKLSCAMIQVAQLYSIMWITVVPRRGNLEARARRHKKEPFMAENCKVVVSRVRVSV